MCISIKSQEPHAGRCSTIDSYRGRWGINLFHMFQFACLKLRGNLKQLLIMLLLGNMMRLLRPPWDGRCRLIFKGQSRSRDTKASLPISKANPFDTEGTFRLQLAFQSATRDITDQWVRLPSTLALSPVSRSQPDSVPRHHLVVTFSIATPNAAFFFCFTPQHSK